MVYLGVMERMELMESQEFQDTLVEEGQMVNLEHLDLEVKLVKVVSILQEQKENREKVEYPVFQNYTFFVVINKDC